MQFTVIVPARLASTRLPNKPLAKLAGKPILLHVLQRAHESGAQRVIAATDAPQLAELAIDAGFEAELTGTCSNGTARTAQAAAQLGLDGVIVNLQGDEPAIDPAVIRQVAQLAGDGSCACATAAAPITAAQAADANIVKVVLRSDATAAYFSRAALPHARAATDTVAYLGHIGIYAFAPGKLAQTQQLTPCPWEQIENLEQLRWLWHGWTIAAIPAANFCHGIDTEADLAAAQAGFAG